MLRCSGLWEERASRSCTDAALDAGRWTAQRERRALAARHCMALHAARRTTHAERPSSSRPPRAPPLPSALRPPPALALPPPRPAPPRLRLHALVRVPKPDHHLSARPPLLLLPPNHQPHFVDKTLPCPNLILLILRPPRHPRPFLSSTSSLSFTLLPPIFHHPVTLLHHLPLTPHPSRPLSP